MNGRLAEGTTMQPMDPVPWAASEGVSEVEGSDDELPSLGQVTSKVQWLDQVKHMLDKGPWAGTPAVCQGWKIFIEVGLLFLLSSIFLADPS